MDYWPELARFGNWRRISRGSS